MKKVTPLLVILCTVFFINACTKNNDASPDRGLVSFQQNPTYTTNKIQFGMQIQFAGDGKAVNIEYKLLDGAMVIASGKALANYNPDGLRLFYVAPDVEITIDGNTLKNKTLTVFLDPDNKVTLPEYTTETYVNLYKKASILIP